MMKKMKYFKIIILSICISFATGCNYLDIIPDNVASMETAFSNRINAERFLFGCFYYLPDPANLSNSHGVIGADEIWWNIEDIAWESRNIMRLAQGYQNTNNPYCNYWDGDLGGKNLFIGIRNCNTFIENIHLPPDLEEAERNLWIAEAKFLKAYFHFYLMHLYGPVPIIRENLPVDASPSEVRVYREPIDDVVNYIVELLDEAVKDLPLVMDMQFINAGRITKSIALALKAKALVWAASPLFNGNPDYVNFKDNRGVQLIPDGTPDLQKWERAAVAIKNAIDTAHLAGHKFHEHLAATPMSDITKLKYSLRGATTEKFNSEIIWPSTHDVNDIQRYSMPHVGTTYANLGSVTQLCATLKVAEQFYTNNGIPIDEDPAWLAWLGGSFDNRYETLAARGTDGTDHQYYIRTNETTAKLNFYREPRFYAYLCFDRGIFEGAGQSEINSYWLAARATEASGYVQMFAHIPTGYYLKKLVNTSTTQVGSVYEGKRYSYPLIRLTDLYLLYAEALNEAGGSTPNPEVYKWIDSVRRRAGLPGVEAAWAKSSVPNKPYNKETLREIIKRERLIELAFEGQRLPDLRRWKDASRYLSEPVKGWNYAGFTPAEYYSIITIWDQRVFNTKEYLWPLRQSTLIVNKNLVQNPGWK
jgi:hypothetical protein